MTAAPPDESPLSLSMGPPETLRAAYHVTFIKIVTNKQTEKGGGGGILVTFLHINSKYSLSLSRHIPFHSRYLATTPSYSNGISPVGRQVSNGLIHTLYKGLKSDAIKRKGKADGIEGDTATSLAWANSELLFAGWRLRWIASMAVSDSRTTKR